MPTERLSVTTPHRVQLSRKAGWKIPERCCSVARPHKWGNPFVIGRAINDPRYLAVANADPKLAALRRGDGLFIPNAEVAVLAYRLWLLQHPEIVAMAVTDLRGLSLACWCPLNRPCHADVLLEIVGSDPRVQAAPCP